VRHAAASRSYKSETMQRSGHNPQAATAEPQAPTAGEAATIPASPASDMSEWFAQRRFLEEHRRWLQRRRWRLVMMGMAVSMPFHFLILLILSRLYMPGVPGHGGIEAAPIEIALIHQNSVSETVQPAMLNEPRPQETPAGLPTPTPLTPSESASESTGDLAPGTMSPMELLVGSGGGRGSGDGVGEGGEGDSLGGGAAGTSFFGVGSRGTRFAYIVDKSGSMEASRRMWTAVRELKRSIGALPDYTYVHVVMYDDSPHGPPFQEGWLRATKGNVGRLERWLDQISPAGGTQPFGGFAAVFSLDVTPDVIFFMTDGEIPEDTVTQLAALNSRGKRVVIHCVAFGDPASQQQLKQIAAESGGQYRFVPMEGP
jgi:hypothetical protein